MLKRLRYFVAVADAQHFGKAAAELHISQPPLSQQIRLLEEQLGFEVFRRTTRSVELTHAGRTLYDGVRPLISDLDQVIHAAKMVHLGESGELRLGFVSTATNQVLPGVMQLFKSRFPHCTIKLTHMTSTQQCDALHQGSIDIGILRGAVPEGISTRVLTQEALIVALPAEHTLATQDAVSVASLRHEPFVMWDEAQAPAMAALIRGLCSIQGFEPTVAVEVIHPAAMLGLVAAGIGVSIVPQSVTHLGAPGVALRKLDDPEAHSDLLLVWSAHKASALTTRFVELVVSGQPSHIDGVGQF